MPTQESVTSISSPRIVSSSVVSRSVSFVSRLFGHSGGNLPGQLALRIAPDAIRQMCANMEWKAVITGTNGKTTTTGLSCHITRNVSHAHGASPLVISNSNGDNMTGGIATALLSARGDMAKTYASGGACVGIFEVDELYTTLLLPSIQPNVLVLLNLSRDQLDRYAEMEMTQRRIADAVLSAPGCSLAYCCDDPLCQGVADMVSKADEDGAHPLIPFGFMTEYGHRFSPDNGQNGNHDGSACPKCGTALAYDARFFGKLGDWRCPECGYGRVEPRVGMSLEKTDKAGISSGTLVMSFPNGKEVRRTNVSGFNGAMASVTGMYDVCAATIASGAVMDEVTTLAGMSAAVREVEETIGSYVPGHGRDETFARGGVTVTTRLAKNPAGMDAAIGSLRNLTHDDTEGQATSASHLLYIAINDQDADGHDVAWLWDSAALGELDAAALGYDMVLCGGTRRDDLAVRLAYGSTPRDHIGLASGVGDAMAEARSMGASHVDAIGNYTAFSDMVRELRKMPTDRWFGLGKEWVPTVKSDRQWHADAKEHDEKATSEDVSEAGTQSDGISQPRMKDADAADALTTRKPVHVYRLFPDALDLYGDSGNAVVLERRMGWRGIDSIVTDVLTSDDLDAVSFEAPGIVTIGGGSDAGQLVAARKLSEVRDALVRFLSDGGIVLAICGGYQLMGRSYEADGGKAIAGLGLIPMETVSAGNRNRIVGNTVDLLGSGEDGMTVVGFENHAGRTRLAAGARPFGNTGYGHGNDGEDLTEGYFGTAYDGTNEIGNGKVIGTYLHGPVLARNAELADALIMMALGGKWDGRSKPDMSSFGGSLDDSLERKAHTYDVLICD